MNKNIPTGSLTDTYMKSNATNTVGIMNIRYGYGDLLFQE